MKWITVSFFLFLAVAAFIFHFDLIKDKPSEIKAIAPPPAWEQEKENLELQISALRKENESLKKQMVEGVLLEIHPGISSSDLASLAHEAGIVPDAADFQKALLRTNAIEHIVPGKYLVSPGAGYETLIEQFTKGVVKK